MGRYNENLNGTAYDQKQNATVASIVTQGENAPSAKPAAKNLLYFATSTQKLYVSIGTSAATDWKEVKAADPA